MASACCTPDAAQQPVMIRFLLAVATAAGTVFPMHPARAEEPAALLGDITPAIPAPPVDIVNGPDAEQASLRLLGIDVEQNAAPNAGAPLVLDGKLPLLLRTYWLVGDAPVVQSHTVSLRFWSNECFMGRTLEMSVGPGDEGTPWRPGSVFREELIVDLPSVAHDLTGTGSLTVAIEQTEGAAPAPLLYLPVHITPFVGGRGVDARKLAAALDRPFRDLAKSFRLGHQARQELEIPEGWGAGVRALAVVSAFSYGAIDQGEPVFDVVAVSESGAAFTWTARSGEGSSRADYDFYLPGTLNHKKIAVFESWDANYPDISGQPFAKHKYLATVALPEDFGTLRSVAVVSRTPYVIDIFDVALLLAAPAP